MVLKIVAKAAIEMIRNNFNYFGMGKGVLCVVQPMQCLTWKSFLFHFKVRFSRGIARLGKAGQQQQSHEGLISGLYTFPMHTTLYCAVQNLTSCPSSLSAQVPYWDAFNTSMGKHFLRLSLGSMAVLLLAILKYFINDYATSGGLWPIPMQSQQLSHLFHRRDCPDETEIDGITTSIIHFN